MDFLGTMDTNVLALMIGVLFVGASAVFGWLLFYVMRSREKDASRRPQASRASDSTVSSPTAGGKAIDRRRDRGTAPMEVLRLLRDRSTGALVVEVGENKYRALRDIKDGRVGRLVLQAAADLVRFTGVVQPQGQAQNLPPSSPPPLAAEPAPTVALRATSALEQAPPVPRTPPPPAVEREFLQSLVQKRSKEPEPPKPSLSPIEFFRRSFAARRQAGVEDSTSVARSLVDEIEDILQRFLRAYPSFVGKEVHVSTGPAGGIRIQVEDEFYDTPDDIPDPEIRGILKAAIQEWEKS